VSSGCITSSAAVWFGAVKDNTIIWLVVGAIVFWLAILFPDATGQVFTAIKHVGQSMMAPFSR